MKQHLTGTQVRTISYETLTRCDTSDTTAVPMERFLKSSLKGKDKEGTKVNLNKYLKVKFKNIFNKLALICAKLASPIQIKLANLRVSKNLNETEHLLLHNAIKVLQNMFL